MHLKSYLNLYALLQNNVTKREEQRAFGLKHRAFQKRPIQQLLAWERHYIHQLKKPLMSETITSYLYVVTLILVIFAFILGIFSGIALLHYNGKEPVNVIYFIVMVVFVPLVTMTLAIVSMFRAKNTHNILLHLTPAYWMEKILKSFPSIDNASMAQIKINPLLVNWIVIRRSQCISLFFYMGLLLALLGIVVTKDIAFAWSTTLHITPEALHRFLNALALPWREFIPTAVPSIELIERSQYFRLGDKLSTQMLDHAAQLGQWWKFLAMATLFYALFLRSVLYGIAILGYRAALRKSLLALDGVDLLLNNMNEPIISTHARESEPLFSSIIQNIHKIHQLKRRYDFIQGWAIPISKIEVMNDALDVSSKHLFKVGGGNTLLEDSKIVQKSYGEVLLYVKAWEPPTLDFVDYVEQLINKVEKVIVYPVGFEEENYQAKEKFIKIWAEKLSLFERHEKIWIKVP